MIAITTKHTTHPIRRTRWISLLGVADGIVVVIIIIVVVVVYSGALLRLLDKLARRVVEILHCVLDATLLGRRRRRCRRCRGALFRCFDAGTNFFQQFDGCSVTLRKDSTHLAVSTSAPATMRIATISRCPFDAARNNAVLRYLAAASILAPAAMSVLTTST